MNLLKKIISASFTLIFVMRCTEPNVSQLLSHYLDVEDIQKVEMSNVNGKFVLNNAQLVNFKKDLNACTTKSFKEIKTGFLTIIITNESGKTFVLRGNDQSDYLQVNSEIVTQHKKELGGQSWLLLYTNGINFNNYKKIND